MEDTPQTLPDGATPIEQSKKPKPTIGRIVIVHHPDGEQIAAIITKVHSDTCVNCTAFIPNGNVSGHSSLCHKDACGNPSANTYWDWPART